MEDKFLSGNELIEKALLKVSENRCSETIMNLAAALQERMNADGHLLLPVEYDDPDNANRFRMLTIPDEDGDLYLACFTSEEELRKGEPVSILSHFIDTFLEAVIDADTVKGAVINPFGAACTLTKGLIQIVLEAKKPSEDDYIRQNYLLEKAIHFATTRHAGQVRKGSTVPYIVHPLETMNILRTMNADPYLLIAGVLHDTVEDTDTKAEEITEIFGTDVAGLVTAHSEDKSKSWQERKNHAITELVQAGRRLKMLVMADKVSNLRSTAADYLAIGDQLWERFNAPMEKQAWFYSRMQDALWDMQNDPDTAHVYWEMVGLYKDIFVKYYLSVPADGGEGFILQVSADGTAYRLDRGDPEWKKIRSYKTLVKTCVCVSRADAESIEDDWNRVYLNADCRDTE